MAGELRKKPEPFAGQVQRRQIQLFLFALIISAMADRQVQRFFQSQELRLGDLALFDDFAGLNLLGGTSRILRVDGEGLVPAEDALFGVLDNAVDLLVGLLPIARGAAGS